MVFGSRLINPNAYLRAVGFAKSLQGRGVSALHSSSHLFNRVNHGIQKSVGFIRRLADTSQVISILSNAITPSNPRMAPVNEAVQSINGYIQKGNVYANQASRYSTHLNDNYQRFAKGILDGPRYSGANYY